MILNRVRPKSKNAINSYGSEQNDERQNGVHLSPSSSGGRPLNRAIDQAPDRLAPKGPPTALHPTGSKLRPRSRSGKPLRHRSPVWISQPHRSVPVSARKKPRPSIQFRLERRARCKAVKDSMTDLQLLRMTEIAPHGKQAARRSPLCGKMAKMADATLIHRAQSRNPARRWLQAPFRRDGT